MHFLESEDKNKECKTKALNSRLFRVTNLLANRIMRITNVVLRLKMHRLLINQSLQDRLTLGDIS